MKPSEIDQTLRSMEEPAVRLGIFLPAFCCLTLKELPRPDPPGSSETSAEEA